MFIDIAILSSEEGVKLCISSSHRYFDPRQHSIHQGFLVSNSRDEDSQSFIGP